MDAALDLLKQNIITKDDFQGNPEEIISEGQIKRGSVLTLPSLRIGRKMIYDVDVIVEPKQDEKLILNNEILSRFGAFTINEDTREIIFE
jgi:predicted aspartyl protease